MKLTTSWFTLKIVRLLAKLNHKDMSKKRKLYNIRLQNVRRLLMIKKLMVKTSTLRWETICHYKRTSFLSSLSTWTTTKIERIFIKREREKTWLMITLDWPKTIKMPWKKATYKTNWMNTIKLSWLEASTEIVFWIYINKLILKSKSLWIRENRSKTRCKKLKNYVSQLLRKTNNFLLILWTCKIRSINVELRKMAGKLTNRTFPRSWSQILDTRCTKQ